MYDYNNLLQSEDLTGSDDLFQQSAMEYISIFTDILNMYYDDSDEISIIKANELAGYSKENKFPVFIVLTNGVTLFSALIRKATGDMFTHASIAFNTALKPLYSFGSKYISLTDPEKTRTGMGFVAVNPEDELWELNNTSGRRVNYAIYATFVNRDSFIKMQQRLQWFINHAEDLKYSFSQLIRVKLNIPSTNQTKWFCSRFVAEIINAGKSTSKDPSLYRPDSLMDLPDTELLYYGDDIRKYDEKKTIQALRRMKRI